MAIPSRTDTSSHAQWLRNLDRVTLTCVMILMALGYILILAASPAVANRIGASSDSFFIFRQVIFLGFSGGLLLATSRLSLNGIRKLALYGCIIALGATAFTLVHGMEIKGARRWIALPFICIQPSEFLKPCFAVTAGWLLSLHGRVTFKNGRPFPCRGLACLIVFCILALLQAQPDIGMLSIIMMVFAIQLFIDGLSSFVFGLLIMGMIGAFCLAYLSFYHVRSRVERFLHPDVGDHYQIDTSLRAFGSGGLFGRGPGEGHIKDLLPDAHADFIFAVAGEEYGFFLCLFIIAVFAFIILRCLLRLTKEKDPFIIISTSGLITGFGLQAFVNMGSTLHLIPTKGMTLPFISYGGSSALSLGLTMGMILALTRHRTEQGLFATPSASSAPLSKRLASSHKDIPA